MRAAVHAPSVGAPGRMVRGAAAGALATVAMSGVMLAARQVGLMGRLPPEKITARLLHRFGRRPSRANRNVLAAIFHVGFGAAGGGTYALMQRGLRPPLPPIVTGVVFAIGIWTFSYMGWVPALGIMPPATEDRPGRPQSMVVAHVVYGAVLGALLGRPNPSSTRRKGSG